MNTPDYGEIAYNAYCLARNWRSFSGEQLPHWNQQSPELRDAWRQAAQAVAEQIAIQTSRG